MGRGTDPDVQVGPLIDHKAVVNTQRLVSDAVDRGATLLAGGSSVDGAGSFFEPTVLDHVVDSMAIRTEEIFAPVVSIIRFRDEADAVHKANDSEYGPVGYVFTEDFERGLRMIDEIDTGMMGLNVDVVSNAAAPFGGVKQSGLGREGGSEGIHEYLESKYTLVRNPFG
jgi:succinate-semialdehyde dehydrogenase/glutarate-semialdehyde dehydrogenase